MKWKRREDNVAIPSPQEKIPWLGIRPKQTVSFFHPPQTQAVLFMLTDFTMPSSKSSNLKKMCFWFISKIEVYWKIEWRSARMKKDVSFSSHCHPSSECKNYACSNLIKSVLQVSRPSGGEFKSGINTCGHWQSHILTSVNLLAVRD